MGGGARPAALKRVTGRRPPKKHASAAPATPAPEGPRIRAAVDADLDAIVRIEQLSFGDPWSRKSFSDSLERSFVRTCVVEDAQGIAGYSVVWHTGEEAELANLAVDPARRGAGLGALLLDALLADAAREGAMVMFLEVRDSNAAARALYASRGFHLVGRRKQYYQNPVEDALVLRRDLAAGAAEG